MITNALLHLLAASQTACPDGTNLCTTGLPAVNADGNQLRVIIQVVLGIIAAVAVLMIVISGVRYVTSEGNPEATKKARATIMYAIIGLILAISAQVIVGFVLVESKK